jgi:hypothetical protein
VKRWEVDFILSRRKSMSRFLTGFDWNFDVKVGELCQTVKPEIHINKRGEAIPATGREGP